MKNSHWLALALAVPLLAACTQTAPESTPTAAATGTTAAPTPTSAATSTPERSTRAAASTDAAGSAALTPPGTTSAIGQGATLLYADLDEKKWNVTVTPTGVVAGSQADFASVDLKDAAAKQATPYYVTVAVRNNEPVPMTKPFLVPSSLLAYDQNGDQIAGLTMIGTFKPCPDPTIDSLDSGKSYTSCQIFMAPPGSRVATLKMRDVDYGKGYLWTV